MEYDYETFLSDSSDDHPKYADGIVDKKEKSTGKRVKEMVEDYLTREEKDYYVYCPSTRPSFSEKAKRKIMDKEEKQK